MSYVYQLNNILYVVGSKLRVFNVALIEIKSTLIKYLMTEIVSITIVHIVITDLIRISKVKFFARHGFFKCTLDEIFSISRNVICIIIEYVVLLNALESGHVGINCEFIVK